MSLLFEIAAVIIAGFCAVIYATDTLYYIYKDLQETEENEEKNKEEEEMKERIVKSMYS